jgi:hypothetical protein
MCERLTKVLPRFQAVTKFQAQYVFDALSSRPLRELRSLHCVFAAFHLMLGNYLTAYSVDTTVKICLTPPQIQVQTRTRASAIDMGCIQRQLTGETGLCTDEPMARRVKRPLSFLFVAL